MSWTSTVSDQALQDSNYLSMRMLLISWWLSRCTTGVSSGASRGITLRAVICFWAYEAQHCSDGAQPLSNTHPWLVEAIDMSMVLEVLFLPGLQELMPQPLYPVVVTGGHLLTGKSWKREKRLVRWDSELAFRKVPHSEITFGTLLLLLIHF